MERDLSVERTYSLGNYQNIRLYDSVKGLPERVALNKEVTDKIRYLQLLQLEITFKDYVELKKKMNNLTMEEIATLLEEERVNTLEEIKDLLTEETVEEEDVES